MIFIYGLTLIFISLLAVPSLLLSKKPDAKEILDKIAPYQGYIGVGFCIWGLIGIIQSLLNFGSSLGFIMGLIASLVTFALGFILGYGLINTHVLSKNEETRQKGAELHAKLVSIQEKLGLAGIAIGILTIVLGLIP